MNHISSVAIAKTAISFGSVCSGIEAASVAWEPLGWKASWFAEIEPFPSAVLAHHWPDVPNLGDMTKIRDRIAAGEVSAPDVLVGGTPCQAFSVAGARKSLSDGRGQLTLEYVRLLNEIDAARSVRGDEPAIAVWENVPGVLNTSDNAFGCLLGALAGEECELKPPGKKWSNAGCVFGPQRAVAWRVLDAQYFGLAQRRKRVFVVSSAREGFNPADVLFEFDGVRRDSAPSREARENIAADAGTGFASAGFGKYRPVSSDGATIRARSGDLSQGGSENLIVGSGIDLAKCLTAGACQRLDYEILGFIIQPTNDNRSTLTVHGTQDPLTLKNTAFPLGRNSGQENVILFEPRSANSVLRIAGDQTLCPTLDTMTGGQRQPCVAYSIHENNRSELRIGDVAPCLTVGGGKPGQGYAATLVANMVRRLTPIECERLQGFPDNHTLIPMNKRRKLEADMLAYIRQYRPEISEEKARYLSSEGPRYSACGNSMAVPVMRWIGERIAQALEQAKH